MPATSAIRAAFLPTGVLRASINLGNPILAGSDAHGRAGGRVDRPGARVRAALGRRELELVVFDAAGKSVDAVTERAGGHRLLRDRPDARRAHALHRPYMLIEGSYLVREGSPLRSNEQVDRTGTTCRWSARAVPTTCISRAN